MILIPLYGRSAMLFHNGKDSYRAVNGVLRVPQQLVSRALDAGFSRQPFADMAPVDEDPATAPDDIVDPVTSTGPVGLINGNGADGAIADSGLPADHPQTAEIVRHDAAAHAAGLAAGTTSDLDDLAAIEARLRNNQ